MKLQYIFFIFICSSFCVQSQQEGKQPSIIIPHGSPVSFITNNYIRSELSQSLENDQKNDQGQANSQLASASATNFSTAQFWVDLYEKQQKDFSEQSNSFLALADDNKIIISCTALLASYSRIVYQIYVANQIINDSSAWSNWQKEKSLEDLFALPQNKLEVDLLYAFQNRYIDSNNPTDFIYSLVQSSVSLENEIDVVRKQIIRYKWIAACRCYKLLFINEDSLQILQEKYRKLIFIKHIFSSWCANYKIEKNSF